MHNLSDWHEEKNNPNERLYTEIILIFPCKQRPGQYKKSSPETPIIDAN
jgi:hypothetical protein